jgi:hypothetical protein
MAPARKLVDEIFSVVDQGLSTGDGRNGKTPEAHQLDYTKT